MSNPITLNVAMKFSIFYVIDIIYILSMIHIPIVVMSS